MHRNRLLNIKKYLRRLKVSVGRGGEPKRAKEREREEGREIPFSNRWIASVQGRYAVAWDVSDAALSNQLPRRVQDVDLLS